MTFVKQTQFLLLCGLLPVHCGLIP